MLRRSLLQSIQVRRPDKSEPERQTAVGKAEVDRAVKLSAQQRCQLLSSSCVDLTRPAGVASDLAGLDELSDGLFGDGIALPVDETDFLRRPFDEFRRRKHVAEPETRRQQL